MYKDTLFHTMMSPVLVDDQMAQGNIMKVRQLVAKWSVRRDPVGEESASAQRKGKPFELCFAALGFFEHLSCSQMRVSPV